MSDPDAKYDIGDVFGVRCDNGIRVWNAMFYHGRAGGLLVSTGIARD